jgi:hypothetical protein
MSCALRGADNWEASGRDVIMPMKPVMRTSAMKATKKDCRDAEDGRTLILYNDQESS